MFFQLPEPMQKINFCVIAFSSFNPEDKYKTLSENALLFCKKHKIDISFIKNNHYLLPTKMKKEFLLNIQQENKVCLSYAGWYNSVMNLSNELLEFIICKKKWFIWFSDSAAILNAITYNTWCITVYWFDYIFTFWTQWWPFFQDLINLINFWILPDIANIKISPLSVFNNLSYIWHVMWWCLSSFVSLLWTSYLPTINNDFIFFIEDINIHEKIIIQNIYQCCLQKNFLTHCKAIVFGKITFPLWKENKQEYVQQKIIDMLKDLWISIPCFFVENFWHGEYNFPLIIGQKMEIFQNNNVWTMRYI